MDTGLEISTNLSEGSLSLKNMNYISNFPLNIFRLWFLDGVVASRSGIMGKGGFTVCILYVHMERERWRFYLRLWLLMLKSAG